MSAPNTPNTFQKRCLVFCSAFCRCSVLLYICCWNRFSVVHTQ